MYENTCMTLIPIVVGLLNSNFLSGDPQNLAKFASSLNAMESLRVFYFELNGTDCNLKCMKITINTINDANYNILFLVISGMQDLLQ